MKRQSKPTIGPVEFIDRGSVVRLRPEISKNKDGRVLPLRGELCAVMERARANRRLDCCGCFISTVSRWVILGRPGLRRAGRRDLLEPLSTILGEPRSGIWSVRVFRNG